MTAFLGTFWGILVEVSPFVILGMLAAGLVHECLGRFQRLRRFALRPGLWSLSFFNLSGFTLPICSCGVVPLAVALRNQGVPFGNVFSFIFSAPATSIAAVILSLAVLGPEFTLFYALGAVACGYAVGVAFYLADRGPAPGPVTGTLYLCERAGEAERNGGLLIRAIRWGTLTYGSRIAFDLIVGLTLAAILISTLSVQDLGSWLADLPFWQAGMLTILIAIPLYVCSLPGIMVGGSLVLGGFPPALIWVFLMAGPVTNLGDINVLRRNLGWRHTLFYIGVVVAVTLAWGWVIQGSVQWADIWAHTREYYATHAALPGFDGEIPGAVAQGNWWAVPRWVHYGSAGLLVLLTLNGARLGLKELWLSPCLHCRHFQQDLRLSPAACTQPCWKSRLIRLVRRGGVFAAGSGVRKAPVCESRGGGIGKGDF